MAAFLRINSSGDEEGHIVLATLISGEDQTNDVIKVEQGQFTHAHKTADSQVKAGAGFIHSVSFAPTATAVTAGMITIYDSLTEAGTIIYREWFEDSEFAGHTITLDSVFTTGCYIGFDGTIANVNATVSYR